ncbi:MAG: YbhB/YbcL family Raf kinase inhibitor-like protein [Bacteroidales bacterium]|nr:YbhB/YbcL family Raf kinase inhibitor-like protein [Bacteroidales bacterium]
MGFALPSDKRFALSDLYVTSTAFAADGAIPARHTGEGEDISPALAWGKLPEGTKSLAVFCHDPDAPVISSEGNYGFVHWVYYNLPATATSLVEGCTTYTTGKNDFGNTGYNGPMPPNGHGQHRYYFWVVALDTVLELDAGLTLSQLIGKIQPHTLGMNRLVGTYERD